MAENEQVKKEQPGQEAGAEGAAPAKKKKRKPNFSKPFIISGILLGVFAGAPFLNLGNYIFGLWGWTFGLLAAWFLSREFKYFDVAQGGMVGFLTGIIGCAITMGVNIGLCVANIDVLDKVAAARPVVDKFTGMMDFWIPEMFRGAIILPTWAKLDEAYRIALAANKPAATPVRVIAGHAFFLVPLIALTAIAGGILGCWAFAKKAPKRQFRTPRRRRPAGTAKPPAPSPAPGLTAPSEAAPAETPPAEAAPAEAPPAEAAPAEAPPAEAASAQAPPELAPPPAEIPPAAQAGPAEAPQDIPEQPAGLEPPSEEPSKQPGSYDYGGGLPGPSEGGQQAPGEQEDGAEQKEE